MSLTLANAPASLAELMLQSVCDHLRVVADLGESPQVEPDDIATIRALTESAVALMDGPSGKLGRALLTQSWAYSIDAFSDRIRLPLAPVQSVSSITYIDADGAQQTLSSSVYRLTCTTGWDPTISLAYDQSWPETRDQAEAVTINFVAGYGDALADVPPPILQGIRMLVGHWYANREAVAFLTPAELPLGVAAAIQPYRIPVMAKRSTMTGGKATARALRQIVPGLAVPLNEASRKAMKPMLAAAKANVPRDTGALRRALTVKRRRSPKDKPVHVVGPRKDATGKDGRKPVRYAHIVEWGRAAGKDGKGAMAGTRFLTRAFESTAEQVLRLFGAEIGPAIERRAAKLAARGKK